MYQNHFAEATEHFERAFELVPTNDLVIQLGVAKWNAGDKAGALKTYQSWLKANPADTQVMFHLANGYLQLGRDEEAVTTFRELLAQKPDDPIIMNNLAWLLRKTNPKQALEFAERTNTIAPEWSSGIDTLGVIVLAQGDTARAYKYFEQALKQAPEDPEIRYHLALASTQMGEKEQAQQILKAILAEPGANFESRKDAEELLLSLKE
jgi:Flp pilus assembly protein TadD